MEKENSRSGVTISRRRFLWLAPSAAAATALLLACGKEDSKEAQGTAPPVTATLPARPRVERGIATEAMEDVFSTVKQYVNEDLIQATQFPDLARLSDSEINDLYNRLRNKYEPKWNLQVGQYGIQNIVVTKPRKDDILIGAQINTLALPQLEQLKEQGGFKLLELPRVASIFYKIPSEFNVTWEAISEERGQNPIYRMGGTGSSPNGLSISVIISVGGNTSLRVFRPSNSPR